MFSIFRKYKAKKHGVRFEVDTFWPPFYISFGRKPCDGCYVLNFIYDAKIGDVVRLLQGERYVHCYKVLAASHCGGSDHIVSDLEFHIEYHHSEDLLK